ncbi:hypothetical protein [Ponticaulis sp.]|uniref:hypothetical protein n=1 Tax=Ponticaulis sp. TaxID=2020902 RepID=UPI000B6FC142|nr:hypothetical protein [Ponticaulis sp.]MAI89800.1 hypothetical protein [Ponticaulis sp.]OUX99477.1 MAG: hypothetical protein CBB65_05115 [Hyphomonadaceae bacterium TMED5]|tara:strand:- start:35202 stop:36839 length:1638 start_codon:yes stop_codon:yes gene_type:complete
MPDMPSGRSAIRAYFDFDDIIERPGWAVLLDVAQIGLTFFAFLWATGYEHVGQPDIVGIRFMEAGLIAAGVYLACALIIFILLSLYKLSVRSIRNTRKSRLEQASKDILRKDYKNALRALLRDTGLKQKDMLNVRMEDAPEFERQLFSTDELDEFLGDVQDKSFRAVSPCVSQARYAPPSNAPLNGWSFFNGLFSCMHIVCLFRTETDYILAEAICDSVKGDLRKRVRLFPRADVESTEFHNRTYKVDLPDHPLDAWLDNRRLDPTETDRVQRRLKQHDRANRGKGRYGERVALPYSIVCTARILEISLKSGEQAFAPVRMEQTILCATSAANADYATKTGATGEIALWSEADDFGDLSALQGADYNAPSREQLVQRRSLWSSGRQARRRMFSTGANFIFALLLTGVVAGSIGWVIYSLTHDTSVRDVSYEADRPQQLTVQDDFSEQVTADALTEVSTEVLSGGEDPVFACTLEDAFLLDAANRQARHLIDLPLGSALIILPHTDATPEGWSEVLAQSSGTEVQGFVPDELYTIQEPPARGNCAR